MLAEICDSRYHAHTRVLVFAWVSTILLGVSVCLVIGILVT